MFIIPLVWWSMILLGCNCLLQISWVCEDNFCILKRQIFACASFLTRLQHVWHNTADVYAVNADSQCTFSSAPTAIRLYSSLTAENGGKLINCLSLLVSVYLLTCLPLQFFPSARLSVCLSVSLSQSPPPHSLLLLLLSLPACRCPCRPSLVPVPAPLRCQRLGSFTVTAAPPPL